MMRRNLFLYFIVMISSVNLHAKTQNDPTKLTAEPSGIKQTAGRGALGEFASKFAELNDDVLFG